MYSDEDPSPALLAARERSRIAEEKLRQHLLAGGSTRSFKQAQPAEIAQSIPEQTYKVLRLACWVGALCISNTVVTNIVGANDLEKIFPLSAGRG